MKRIAIAAGGSGGHIFPAIALGRSLSACGKDIDILHIGSDKALDRRIFEKEGVRYSMLSANKLSYGISPRTALAFFRLLADVFRAVSIIRSYRPDVAVGFGGYVSFPVVFAAKLFGIPSIVHEQNVVPGRANRLLFRLARKIAVSFEETSGHIGRYAGKCVLTGNPVRAEISRSLRLAEGGLSGPSGKKFTILVIGGSQGASFLNRTFIAAVSSMDAGSRSSIQAIHITGVKDYEWASRSYADIGIEHRVHSFVDRIEDAYAAADIVVTRSGASAIFELALLRKPMILVPYPFAMSHQLDNALVFSGRGAALLAEEKDLDAGRFAGIILALMKDANRVKALSEAAGRLAKPHAADDLAREVMDLTRNLR
ncbi:MAG: undecaprenyldiphospho-muramoylpentapeptide beta-N-acetylglucosaminyltransferase [Candidatus Omnitrophota bacterium]